MKNVAHITSIYLLIEIDNKFYAVNMNNLYLGAKKIKI